MLAAGGRAQDQAGRLAASFPEVVVHRLEGADCSAAKSAALAGISSDFVVFLDADERLTPVAIEAGLDCFAENPNAWLVCGAHRVIDAAAEPASPVWHERVDPRQSSRYYARVVRWRCKPQSCIGPTVFALSQPALRMAWTLMPTIRSRVALPVMTVAWWSIAMTKAADAQPLRCPPPPG